MEKMTGSVIYALEYRLCLSADGITFCLKFLQVGDQKKISFVTFWFCWITWITLLRNNTCLQAVLESVSVSFWNIWNLLELSGLFACLVGLVKVFSDSKDITKLLGRGLLGGITTQTDTIAFILLRY